MKRLVFYILLFGGLATLAFASLQENKSADTPPANANFVADDDGGLTEIVPADPTRQGPRASGAVPVMKSVQQVSIFLGAAWGDRQARTRQTRLPDFPLNHSEAALTELRHHNMEVIPAAARVEDFSDLSKGPVNDLTIQRKLVEIARALMLQPKILLLDEPFAGINPRLQNRIVEHLHTLCARGITVFFIDHEMRIVLTECDLVHVLAEGRLISSGDTQTVRNDAKVLEAYF